MKRYMMATKATHMLGDISREEPDLCFITGVEENCYIGHWVEGFGFINVEFPKETTRELTAEEKEKYHGKIIQIGGYGIDILNVKEYGTRLCDKCGQVVLRENSMMLLQKLRGKIRVAGYNHDRHLLPVKEQVPCEGSPSRAQYIEGQPRDPRGIYGYFPAMEKSVREAYAKMMEEINKKTSKYC